MNEQEYLYNIRKHLAWFTSQVKLENKNGNFDINKYAEKFFIPILNEIFGKEFVRLEFEKANFPAIDLGNRDNQIAIQITAEIGYDKIKKTLSSFIEHRLFETYSELFHLIIDEDYTTRKTGEEISEYINNEISKLSLSSSITINFLPERNILNISKLISLINEKCDVAQHEKIYNYLKSQYNEINHPYKNPLIPYRIAFKEQLNKENKNLSTQFHTPFIGREKDIEKLDSFINNKSEKIIAITSDGGYGKTRLAIEVFNKYTQDNKYDAYLLNASASHCLDFYKQLNSGKETLILFDDAHKKPEILNDVIDAALRSDKVKLIITLRKNLYWNVITTVPTHNRKIEKLELKRLSYEETQALFKSQLPHLDDIYIKQLSEQSKGVPIVVLALCQLRLKGKYKSELSEDDNFIQLVTEVKNEVISDIHQKHFVEKNKINKVIELISFFSPIKNIPEEINVLAQLNSMSIEDTNLIIDYLYEAGFITKDYEISIIPDPYSDTILLESIHRVKYLVQDNLGTFNNRLVRNIIEVEESQRLSFNIDGLLSNFIASFGNTSTDSYDDLEALESSLKTLKSFAYKKPVISFIAINNLITSLKQNETFWLEDETISMSSSILRRIHEDVETIISIIALNTHRTSQFDSIYELLIQYTGLKRSSQIFNKVFRYRVFDFYELGYRPVQSCERQLYLTEKLKNRIKNEEVTDELFHHIQSSCKTLLAEEFEAENYFDSYTHSFHFRNYRIFANDITKKLRKDALKLLIDLYIAKRHTIVSQESLKQILRTLFYMKEQHKLSLKQFDDEVEMVMIFLQNLLNNEPSIYEKSSIIKQLKLFNIDELRPEFKEKAQTLLNNSQKTESPKQKLELLIYDEYFSIRKNTKETLKQILQEYDNINLFFSDLIDIKQNDKNNIGYGFNEILNHLIIDYPDVSIDLFNYVFTNFPELTCLYSILVKANYKDSAFFYSTINNIWNLDYDCAKGAVLWLLTNGRNRDSSLYRESDLEFIEKTIQSKQYNALREILLTLPQYIQIAPQRTLNLISDILNINKMTVGKEWMFQALFEDQGLLNANSELILNFIQENTFSIPLNFHHINNMLVFIEDNFGFDALLNYLTKYISVYEKENTFVILPIIDQYKNPNKVTTQTETDFLKVLNWYSHLPSKDKYIHKEIVKLLRPNKLESSEFKDGFKKLVKNADRSRAQIIDLFDGLDVYKNNSDDLVKFKIEIVNELCDNIDFSQAELTKIFGSDFIYNDGAKSGTFGQPFPQDIEKREKLEYYLSEYKMHSKIKEIFTYALERVKKDIEREGNEGKTNNW